LLAFFAGGHTNEHEVTKVHDGTRYTVGSFWDNADSVYRRTNFRKRKKLKKTRAEQKITYIEWENNKNWF
jgi:heme-degrading monooxygenase HmoA